MTHLSENGRFKQHPETAHIRHDFFSTSTPDSDWLAGLLAADGNITKDNRRWRLSQSGDHGREMIDHARHLVGHRLTVYEEQPKMENAKVAHGIYVPSEAMVRDLAARYGIVQKKTLIYRYPDLESSSHANFMRGYIDGDGCVGIYGKYHDRLHLSVVGTEEFIHAAQLVVPAEGRVARIKKCPNLFYLAFNGQKAWAAGDWIYQDRTVYESAKFHKYLDCVTTRRPKWMVDTDRRDGVADLLKSGSTVAEAAEQTGVSFGTIYKWRRKGLI